MILGFVYLAGLDNPELEKIEVQLHNVEVSSVNKIDNDAQLEVTFLIKNPGEKTFTISNIRYELFANGKLVGNGQYSNADVALPGRVLFVPGAEIEIGNPMKITPTEAGQELYNSIINGEITDYSVKGTVTLQTSWSEIDKEFTSHLK